MYAVGQFFFIHEGITPPLQQKKTRDTWQYLQRLGLIFVYGLANRAVLFEGLFCLNVLLFFRAIFVYLFPDFPLFFPQILE